MPYFSLKNRSSSSVASTSPDKHQNNSSKNFWNMKRNGSNQSKTRSNSDEDLEHSRLLSDSDSSEVHIHSVNNSPEHTSHDYRDHHNGELTHNNDHHLSMMELKRFFKSSSNVSKKQPDPFHDEKFIAKYGQLGEIIGSGAGGSVHILKTYDNHKFAMKQFRPIKHNEQKKDYAKKCHLEFNIGVNLKHENIIKTLEIIQQNDKFFEIMEYCPMDFFAVVMSNRMNRFEINCCFKQICNGVGYLHSLGIAHRDLKLDNIVVSESGILKIIDFGSAIVFKDVTKNNPKIIKTHGVIGSDPYMAPEIFSPIAYDPEFVDVWSLAIIYSCMTIKRFPWRFPKPEDNSFRLFTLPDDKPHDYKQAAIMHNEIQKERRRARQEQERKNSQDELKSTSPSIDKLTLNTNTKTTNQETDPNLLDTIKRLEEKPKPRNEEFHDSNHTVNGPYRLMRLLPHAARPLISGMLKVDPAQRFDMKSVLEDEWFKSIHNCKVDETTGEVVRGPGHVHTEIKGKDAHLQSYKERERKQS